MNAMTPLLDMEGVHKRFVLHLQNQTVLDVLRDFSLRVLPGECVRLSGPSGMGKSTVLKLAFGNYRPARAALDCGRLMVLWWTLPKPARERLCNCAPARWAMSASFCA